MPLGHTCHSKLAVDSKQAMLPVKYFCSNKAFLSQSTFMVNIRLSQSAGESGHPQFLGILPDL